MNSIRLLLSELFSTNEICEKKSFLSAFSKPFFRAFFFFLFLEKIDHRSANRPSSTRFLRSDDEERIRFFSLSFNLSVFWNFLMTTRNLFSHKTTSSDRVRREFSTENFIEFSFSSASRESNIENRTTRCHRDRRPSTPHRKSTENNYANRFVQNKYRKQKEKLHFSSFHSRIPNQQQISITTLEFHRSSISFNLSKRIYANLPNYSTSDIKIWLNADCPIRMKIFFLSITNIRSENQINLF